MKLIAILALISQLVFAGKALILTENKVIDLSKESTVMLERIKAQALEGKKAALTADKNLGFTLYGGYNYTKTKEKAINPFIPVFSPINQYKLGVQKNFKYGVSSKFEAAVDSRSSPRFSSINTSSLSVEFGFDLWEDFLGRMTKREYENSKLSRKQLEIKEDIDTSVYLGQSRRIYWSLIANSMKYELTQKLFKTAKKQLSEAKDRKKQSVADASEVARYASQVSERKGQLLLLKYEKENLLKALKEFFPSIRSEQIVLGAYNIDKTIFEVLSCTQKISRTKGVPFKYTKYDEMSQLLSSIQKNQEKIDDSSGISLKLKTRFLQTGVSSNNDGDGTFSGSFQGSLDDMNDNNREGFEAGLQFSIPLGEASSDLKDVNKLINKKKLEANIGEINTKIKITHDQIVNSINILTDVMKAQKENSGNLKTRVKVLRRKYAQGRLPLYAVIQDEDSLMNNELSIIDTQLTILNTLLDYFVVFTDMPCAFNRK